MECPQSIKLALERRDVIFQFLNVVHYGLPQFDDEIDWRSGAALAVSYLFFERERRSARMRRIISAQGIGSPLTRTPALARD